MNPTTTRLILASKSPRRRELLSTAGYRFEVIPPDEAAEAGVDKGRRPEDLVRELAYRKAADVVSRLSSGEPDLQERDTARTDEKKPRTTIVLGCDTVVECGGKILGKPTDRSDARRMLQILRGHEHRVISGLCLWPIRKGEPLVEVASTTLRTDQLSDAQLDDYLAGDDWKGKAGAFGYQDRTGWVHVVEGSESNVVGLPLERLAAMLVRLGYRAPSSSD